MTDILDKLDLVRWQLDVTVAKEAAAEIRRLRAGGCARDQGTTQFCAEVVKREEVNERLLHVVSLGVKMRFAQAAYFKNRTKDNLIASKVAEADFDKAAKALGDGA